MLELQIGEAVDRLITIPISIGGGFESRPYILDLYKAARERMVAPLSFSAARRLSEEMGRESFVIFLTGVTEPLTLHPAPDGPIGTAVLARALALQFDAIPVVLSEGRNLEAVSMALKLAGLSPTDDVDLAREKKNKAVILEAPMDVEGARAQAIRLMDELYPRAVISIEKFGRNDKGVYHAGVGLDVSNLCARVDEVVEEANRMGILTIGIGDLGNEIGFGLIKDAVREVVATGKDCGCPCKGGIAATTETSTIVVASVSNWGAYGVAACLAALHRFPELLHTPEMERRLIETLTSTITPDSLSGLFEPLVDGIPLNVHVDLVDLLNSILNLRLEEGWRYRRYKELTSGKNRETLQEQLLKER